MFQNIILIILIILLFFFLSNDEKVNDLMSKKYIKYLFILLIIYFIYQNYNLSLLLILLLIFLFFNVDFKNKILNNKYFESFKDLSNIIKEKFENFDFEDDIEKDKKKVKIEPFKEEVTKLKDLYENIKMEIKKIA
jgi:hypothetical protein